MHKRGQMHMVLVLFSILLVVILTIVFFITKNTGVSTMGELPAPTLACNTLKYEGEGAINLVFFASEAQTQEYIDYMFGIAPYDRHTDKFNIYYIDQQPECEVYKGIAILCHSKELVELAGACPHDYRIVLTPADNYRSSAYQQTGSINTHHPPSVLAHEIGHLFLFLDEEYVPARPHDDSINCKESCDEFLNPESCFEGCSTSSLYRSESAAVMRTLRSEEYGEHNEAAIEEWIIAKTSGSVQLAGYQISEPQDCADQHYYVVTPTQQKIVRGCAPLRSADTSYSILVVKEGSPVFEIGFDPLIRTEGPDREGNDFLDGEVFLDEVKSVLTVPEIDDADTILIRDENDEVIETIAIGPIGRTACLV